MPSPELRTRWMSPGGAKPATVPGRFWRRVTAVSEPPSGLRPKISSYSMPASTPVTHQET